MNGMLTDLLHTYHGISLEELSRAPLMNRTDEKFAFHLKQLPEILETIREHYDVLNIDGKVIFNYTSQYFDDDDFTFFHDHHKALPRRFKVRMRTYIDTGMSFLEVKEKKKGRTDKKRISIPDIHSKFSEGERDFLASRIPDVKELKPVMLNTYSRITLVNKHCEERLTIDFDIKNSDYGAGTEMSQTLSRIVIAELKQPKLDRHSPFFKLMRSKGIRPFRISKFCFGMMDIKEHKNLLKSNRFKSKQLYIQKLSKNAS
jgi:hypothetical protein